MTFMGGFYAINLFGIIFTVQELNAAELNHERIHTAQQRELLYIGFYLWYMFESLLEPGTGGDGRDDWRAKLAGQANVTSTSKSRLIPYRKDDRDREMKDVIRYFTDSISQCCLDTKSSREKAFALFWLQLAP